MVKRKNKLFIILCIIFTIFLVLGFILFHGIRYSTQISKAEIEKVTELSLDEFEITNCYSQKASSVLFNYFIKNFTKTINAFVVVEVKNDKNYTKADIFNKLDKRFLRFSNCPKDEYVVKYVNKIAKRKNISWLKNMDFESFNWNIGSANCEDESFLGSVDLYVLYNNEAENFYIILDQRNYCGLAERF